MQRALTIKRRVLGAHHPEIAALLNNLAALQAELGHFDRANRSYTEALAIFHATLGADHPHTHACRDNINRLNQLDHQSRPPRADRARPAF
jgi:hypothetical protein